MVDRIKKHSQVNTDIYIPLDVSGTVNNLFEHEAVDVVTSFPLNWGTWEPENRVYNFEFNTESTLNYLQSSNFKYKGAVDGSINDIASIICVREFREKIIPKTKQVLRTHIPGVKMTNSESHTYCESLRTSCPFDQCSKNWYRVLPDGQAEEEYLLTLASEFWTSDFIQTHINITVKNEPDFDLNVYAPVTPIDNDELVWINAATKLPVICGEYKYGFRYSDLATINANDPSINLYATISGQVDLVMTMGNQIAKDSENICKAIHADAKVMDFSTTQDYYDFVSQVNVNGKHLLQRNQSAPYINTGSGLYPAIHFPDKNVFYIEPSYAEFVTGEETIWLDCYVTLQENWKTMELEESSFEYNLVDVDSQNLVENSLRLCSQMEAQVPAVVNNSDFETYVTMMRSRKKALKQQAFATDLYGLDSLTATSIEGLNITLKSVELVKNERNTNKTQFMCIRRTVPNVIDDEHTTISDNKTLEFQDPNGFVESRIMVTTLETKYSQPSFDLHEQVCHRYNTFPSTCFQPEKIVTPFLTESSPKTNKVGVSWKPLIQNTFDEYECTSVVETVQTKEDKIIEFRRDWRSLTLAEAETKCKDMGYTLFQPSDALESSLFTMQYMTKILLPETVDDENKSMNLTDESMIKPCFLPSSELTYWNVGNETENSARFICAKTLREPIQYVRKLNLTADAIVPFIPTLFDLTFINEEKTSDPVIFSFYVQGHGKMNSRKFQTSDNGQLKTFRNLDNGMLILYNLRLLITE